MVVGSANVCEGINGNSTLKFILPKEVDKLFKKWESVYLVIEKTNSLGPNLIYEIKRELEYEYGVEDGVPYILIKDDIWYKSLTDLILKEEGLNSYLLLSNAELDINLTDYKYCDIRLRIE